MAFVFWLQFLAESLDFIQDSDWIMSLGNVFTKHYELYASDDEHAALLHRYLYFMPLVCSHIFAESMI